MPAAPGFPLASEDIATSESWRDAQSGERRERTEWHRVVIWNEGLGDIAEKYLVRGAKVYVEGKLTTEVAVTCIPGLAG